MTPHPLPGIGAHDDRVRVDPDVLPWRALGKLRGIYGNLVVNCTGTLIGPKLVLTAAHCVVNPKTHSFFPPQALHFLLAFTGGESEGQAVGTRITVAATYDPRDGNKALASDWALLAIDKPLGTPDRILALEPQAPLRGTEVTIGGYNQDHALLLFADPACRIVGRAVDEQGRQMLRHNCNGTGGTSGAPVLVEHHGSWFVAGVQVAVEKNRAGGVAAMVDAIGQRF